MPELPRLILATRNAHKTEEIRHILGDRFEVLDVRSFPELPEIEETGTTFLENARLKMCSSQNLSCEHTNNETNPVLDGGSVHRP